MAHPIRLTEKVISSLSDEELRKRGYILGITLGEGSYAKVKSAYSEWINKKVALKIINKRKAPKDFQQKFLPRELDILKRLHHPNVVQLYDIMQFDHKVYIAMEIAGHGDLLEYIKLRGAIQEDKARRFFYQLTSAVEYLHSIDVIHRDLKCENILLDCQNNIKVSDFGFARLLLPEDVSKTFCGSAAYAAPEILQGIPYSGFAYDIWSMGVILYIMVCGSMPYDDSNIKKMIKHQTERKVGFSKSKKVSDICKNLIHRLLEAVVKKRASIPEVLNHPWVRVEVENNAKLQLQQKSQQPPTSSTQQQQGMAAVQRPDTAPVVPGTCTTIKDCQTKMAPDKQATVAAGIDPYQRPQVKQGGMTSGGQPPPQQQQPPQQQDNVTNDVRRMTLS